MTGIPSFREQAGEVELHFLGLRDLVARATAGKIKRGAEEIDRMRHRMHVAEHAAATLSEFADRQEARQRTG